MVDCLLKNIKFREDINILRGVSILLVVVFHFYPQLLPNGYLGVDVFFIISGFLITLGILRDKEKNKFSYIDFYKRRVHRIIPAVLAMLVLVTIFEMFILLPSDLVSFASSLDSTLLFFANIHFFLTGGYFGGNDEVKPLLHMWSLSIEEQFYILFPFLFILSIRSIKKPTYLIFFILTFLFFSYSLNILLSFIGGQNASFFLLPTRIWQFLVGCIAALILHERNDEIFGYKYISLFGCFLMVLNIFIIIPIIPSATIISLGVFLIIINSLKINNNIIMRLLSFLGKISFSLYLWHWPIASFLNYYNVNEIEAWQSIVGFFLSVVISYLSWKYIEERFRKTIKTKRLLILIGFIYLGLIGVSFFLVKSSGIQERYNADVNEISMAIDSNFRCPKIDSFPYGGSKACIVKVNNNKNYDTAVLGNSHSLMYAPIVAETINKSVLVVPLNGCTPTFDININSLCLKQFKKNIQKIAQDDYIKRLVIGTTWSNFEMIDDKDRLVAVTNSRFNSSLLNTIRFLQKSGKEVYLIGPIVTPSSNNNFASDLSRSMAFGYETNNIKQKIYIDKFLYDYSRDVSFWNNKLGNHFIQTYKNLCDDKFCYFRRNGNTYFADSNHLSQKGAQETKPSFIRSFNKLPQ